MSEQGKFLGTAGEKSSPAVPALPFKGESDRDQLYYRITASDLLLCSDLLPGSDLQRFQFFKQIDQGGDHIFCENIDGGATWGVRLGNINPIIPLHPGRNISREFRRFTLYCTQPAPTFSSPGGNGDFQETAIELYISRGLLIQDSQPAPRGFGSRTVGRTDCVASTTKRLILDDFNKPGGFPNSPNITQWKPGRRGATLLIRNADPINTIFIAQQSSTTFAPQLVSEMWRLYAGETLTLDLDGSIQQAFNQIRMIGTPDVGFVIYTKSGTANYDWMLSRLDCDPAPNGTKNDVGINLG